MEHDSLNGGLDSTIHRINRFGDLGFAWTNIALDDPAFVDQAASTIGTGITLNDDGSEITLRDSTGLTVHGPAGEPRIERNVSGAEVFNLEANPAPDLHPSPLHPDYPLYGDDAARSTFGAPNEWDDGGNLEIQDLGSYATTLDANSIPYFSTLPAIRYGQVGTTTSQPVIATDFEGTTGLVLSLFAAPPWVSLLDQGDGAGLLEWTPPPGTAGFHAVTLRVSDGIDSFQRPVTIFVHPASSPVILNEYNAVSSSSFLNGGTAAADESGGTASDIHFGRVAGNGGDWFELVVVGNDDAGTLDMRGWQIEIATDPGFPFAAESVLELSNDPRWAAVPHGTILTFTEERAAEGGMDTALDVLDRSATDGWTWSNFWIGDPQFLIYTSEITNGYRIDAGTGAISRFDITDDRTQFVIRDAAGNHVFGPAGEGLAPAGGINNRNAWELVDHPRSTVNPLATANLLGPEFGAAASDLESTFGRPNRWNGGSEVQDFLAFSGAYGDYVTAAGLSGTAALAAADGDGDGVTNGGEFAHGSDPGDALAVPEFLPGVTDSLGVTFLLRAGGTTVGDTYLADGVGIIVQFSTDLRDWTPTTTHTSNPAGLPAPPPGYAYATFQIPAAVFNASHTGFLRVVTVIP
ncbi:MAG: hypothetical protein HKO57_15680 [Akkermansiaceae bacterium]|nr:hypothetical protein [Akkermansiaceae bacterium]